MLWRRIFNIFSNELANPYPYYQAPINNVTVKFPENHVRFVIRQKLISRIKKYKNNVPEHLLIKYDIKPFAPGRLFPKTYPDAISFNEIPATKKRQRQIVFVYSMEEK